MTQLWEGLVRDSRRSRSRADTSCQRAQSATFCPQSVHACVAIGELYLKMSEDQANVDASPFWNTPELIEELLPFLTKCLAETHDLIHATLLRDVVLRKLVRRAFPSSKNTRIGTRRNWRRRQGGHQTRQKWGLWLKSWKWLLTKTSFLCKRFLLTRKIPFHLEYHWPPYFLFSYNVMPPKKRKLSSVVKLTLLFLGTVSHSCL